MFFTHLRLKLAVWPIRILKDFFSSGLFSPVIFRGASVEPDSFFSERLLHHRRPDADTFHEGLLKA